MTYRYRSPVWWGCLTSAGAEIGDCTPYLELGLQTTDQILFSKNTKYKWIEIGKGK